MIPHAVVAKIPRSTFLKIYMTHEYVVRRNINRFEFDRTRQLQFHVTVVEDVVMGWHADMKLTKIRKIQIKKYFGLESASTPMSLCPPCGLNSFPFRRLWLLERRIRDSSHLPSPCLSLQAMHASYTSCAPWRRETKTRSFFSDSSDNIFGWPVYLKHPNFWLSRPANKIPYLWMVPSDRN